MTEWIKYELGPNIPLHINRYYPAYKMTKKPIPDRNPYKSEKNCKPVSSSYIY